MKNVFQTVALIGKYMSPENREHMLALARFLNERQVGVFIEEQTAQSAEIKGYTTLKMSAIGAYADLAIVIGGDGTMLSVARALVDYKIPLVGVNRGRLGFLTDIDSDRMLDNVTGILNGQYETEERILLAANIVRAGETVGQGYALNDVVVNKSGMARLIELEVHIDGHFVQRQRSDGLIVATPTGTTAYSLSAGGPILHPTLDAIALVPICPHTLSNRPIAIDSASKVVIEVVHAEDASVHLDGQRKMALQPKDQVQVQRAKNTLTLLHPPGHNYFDVLREKLHWG